MSKRCAVVAPSLLQILMHNYKKKKKSEMFNEIIRADPIWSIGDVDKQLPQQLEGRCSAQKNPGFFSRCPPKLRLCTRLIPSTVTLTLDGIKSCRASFCSGSPNRPFIQLGHRAHLFHSNKLNNTPPALALGRGGMLQRCFLHYSSPARLGGRISHDLP